MTDDRKRIVVFSGTTEGRQLSEKLNKRGIGHTVCVATEYGELLQPKGEHILVEEGRKDLEEIRALIENAEVVVDATHPYARLITENIKSAAENMGVRLLRVLRGSELEGKDSCGVTLFDSTEGCRDALAKTSGNILFTTGSKELALLCAGVSDKERLYARVLPSAESLRLCEEAGVRTDHVLALQGPFSEEMNLAILKQYGIEILVTKDSGKAGGFEEKISACRKAGAAVYCIKRPEGDSGISPDEALKEILGIFGRDTDDKPEPAYREATCERELVISIIGMGMGNCEGLTLEASKALGEADVVFGAERLLEEVSCINKYPCYLAKDIIAELENMLASEQYTVSGTCLKIAVLFSGDIGFYSGAEKFEKEIRKWADGSDGLKVPVNKYPGISSVSFLSSRLGEGYSGAEIISLHGKNSDEEIRAAAKRIAEASKSFVLVSGGEDVRRLADSVSGVRITVASNLSYENERICTFASGDDIDLPDRGLYTLFIENHAPAKRLLIPYMEDEDFTRNKTPMTKALIRHECIRQLRLKEGDVLFDVGSGTGSVAIEAARLSDSLKVFSFEKKTEAIAVQKENIGKFECSNIVLIEGEAPQSFERADRSPDAVFIGGSSGKFKDILEHLRSYGRPIRVVITAITMETMNEIMSLRDEPDVAELEIQQITGSRAEKVGDYNLMKTENSVMVAAFRLGNRDEE